VLTVRVRITHNTMQTTEVIWINQPLFQKSENMWRTARCQMPGDITLTSYFVPSSVNNRELVVNISWLLMLKNIASVCPEKQRAHANMQANSRHWSGYVDIYLRKRVNESPYATIVLSISQHIFLGQNSNYVLRNANQGSSHIFGLHQRCNWTVKRTRTK
jgi:hypothetical protein